MNTGISRQLSHGALGALGGAGFWWLTELPEGAIGRTALAASVLALAFSTALLMLVGRLGWRPALRPAIAIAALVAGLMSWGSFGYDTAKAYTGTGYPLLWATLATFLPLPFLLGRKASGRAFDGQAVVLACFGMMLKIFAAFLFLGIFWVALVISKAVLNLVGINFLVWLFASGFRVMVICGAVLGIALAFADEAPEGRVAGFVARALSVFLPLALTVSLAFVAVAPFRGLSHLFGARSTAQTLSVTAFCAIFLIACHLVAGRNDTSVRRFLGHCARGLSLILPLLAGLALYALWLRVDQHGWTPDRIAGVTIAAILTLWGLLFAFAAPLRDWTARLERAAAQGGMLALLAAVLSLTPLLDAGAISVRSQAARYAEGRIGANELPVREMMNDWGLSGPAALADLAALPGREDNARLVQLIDWARTAKDRWTRPPADPAEDRALTEDLVANATILPKGTVLPEWLFGLLQDRGRFLVNACARPSSPSEGCYLIVADFRPDFDGDEVLVLRLAQRIGEVRAESDLFSPQLPKSTGSWDGFEPTPIADPAAFRAALEAGRYALVTPPERLLSVEGLVVGAAPAGTLLKAPD